MSDTQTPRSPEDDDLGEASAPSLGARLTIEQAAPLVRLKTYELVAQRLLEDIECDALPTGALVPGEVEIAETLRVGRSSVREALRVLESRGLIARAGSGRFTVAEHSNPISTSLSILYDLHRVDLVELFELRALVEIESAGLAAARRTPADLQAIGAALGAMRWGSLSTEELYSTDTLFHVAIAEASGNRATARLVEALRQIVYSALHGPLFTRTARADFSSATTDEHAAIVEAIANEDSAAAREMMGRHLRRVSEQSLKLLERAEPASGTQSRRSRDSVSTSTT
jgi:GntR family transcriptional repressor for pyruvate dehydrogenase complex